MASTRLHVHERMITRWIEMTKASHPRLESAAERPVEPCTKRAGRSLSVQGRFPDRAVHPRQGRPLQPAADHGGEVRVEQGRPSIAPQGNHPPQPFVTFRAPKMGTLTFTVSY